MRKNAKLLSLVALVLVAATLLSACGFKPGKANLDEYLTLDPSKYTGISAEANKVIIGADDVTKYILELRASGKEVDKKDATEGNISQFDDVEVRYIAVDANGYIVKSNIGLKASSSSSTSTTPAWDAGTTLKIGYMQNTGLGAEIEKVLYDATGAKQIALGEQLIDLKTKGDIGKNAWFYITYTANVVEGTNKTTYKSITTAEILNAIYYQNKTEQGKNNIMEAIALGLKKIEDTLAKKEQKLSVTDTTQTTITVYPTGTEVTDETEAHKVGINYAIEQDGVEKQIEIKLTVKAAAYPSEGAAPKTFSYKFPEDATGTYKAADGKATDIKNTETTVYVYTTKRTSYKNIPAYDATFIKDKGGFTSPNGTTELEALKAEYEADVKKTLQEKADLNAKKIAMTNLFNKVVDGTIVTKWPEDRIKAYQKEFINNYKYYYYDDYYNGVGYKDIFTSSTFEEFAVAQYGNSNIKNYEALKDAIWEDGKTLWKGIMVAYYMAGIYGITIEEEAYDAYVNRKANEWIQELTKYYGVSADQLKLTVKDYIKQEGEENLEGAYITDLVYERLYQENESGVTYKPVNSDGSEYKSE